MAEGNGAIYNRFKELVLSGGFDLSNGGNTIKVGLVTGHTPNIDTHYLWSDVSGDEVADGSYAAGGNTLAGQTVDLNSGSDRADFDATDLTFTALDGVTPSHAIMYATTSTPVNTLIAYWEVTTVANGGNYTLAWHANGIILLT